LLQHLPAGTYHLQTRVVKKNKVFECKKYTQVTYHTKHQPGFFMRGTLFNFPRAPVIKTGSAYQQQQKKWIITKIKIIRSQQ
jgi:hypothetical protein